MTVTDPTLACYIADECRWDPRCGGYPTCMRVDPPPEGAGRGAAAGDIVRLDREVLDTVTTADAS